MMPKISILITLLFSTMVYGDTPSCSEYFTYSVDPKTRVMSGQITIPPPAVNDEFYLKVALKTNVHLTDGSFHLELVRSIKDSIEAIQHGRSLLYRVNFPSEDNFPIVSEIWFNNQQYCLNSEASGNWKHTIELGHIVYPPKEESNLQNFQPWHRNASSYRVYDPTYYYLNDSQPTIDAPSDKTAHNEEHISSNSTINNECGVTSYYTDSTNNLVPNCENSLPGQWPWVVAIYVLKSERTSEFRCSGSILTTKHIITVEPCLKLKRYANNTIQIPDNMYAAFGQFNSRQWHGMGNFNRKVTNFRTTGTNYIYNNKIEHYLAILTVETPVEYSPFIKPICLWYRSDDFADVVHWTGYVVGYDRNVSQTQNIIEEPRMSRVTVLDKEHCLADNPNATSKNRFCVELENVGQSCYADSGSGVVFYAPGRYMLRGIVLEEVTTATYICHD
ncbi:PREDICTED: serine protease gd-like isoform X2 [Vollenhovia emeryi]|nr:PREDICTED: serine protease gd-like isoform X2 [Vollenhovia emeryi]